MNVPLYPHHAPDAGPWLPTAQGGIICSKCHVVIDAPNADILAQAVAAHEASGEPPIDTERRPPKRVSDLTARERGALVSILRGNGKRLRVETAAPLVMLKLVEEEWEEEGEGDDATPRLKSRTLIEPNGARLARLCEEAARPADIIPMFDESPIVAVAGQCVTCEADGVAGKPCDICGSEVKPCSA